MQAPNVPLVDTMKIHLRCSCGCEFFASGASATRVIEEADKWQARHLNCQQPQAGEVLPWLVAKETGGER